jgi:hypothetical protein
MTPTLGTVHRTLDAAALKDLATQKGPCLTLFIPDRHPGAQAGSRTALMRDMLHRAEALLQNNPKLQSQAVDLLAPLAVFAETDEVAAGGAGFAIFRSPHHLEVFNVPGTTAETVALASHFTLLPLLERVYTPQQFYILGLSRKRLRLLRYRLGVCEEVAMPPQVPESVQAAAGLDAPDHDLENRSSAGVNTGSMKAVHFGTTTDREAAGEYLYHFLGQIAHGLKDTLNGAPLLLAGVHEEATAYRRASKYPHILEAEIQGNIEFLSLEEIARFAASAAREHYLKAGHKVLAELREMPDRNRTLAGDPHPVLRAAAAGRVHRLCVREMTGILGPMEPELDTVHGANEDLLNAAVVETIRHGGEVFALPPDQMPASNPVAAVLRF